MIHLHVGYDGFFAFSLSYYRLALFPVFAFASCAVPLGYSLQSTSPPSFFPVEQLQWEEEERTPGAALFDQSLDRPIPYHRRRHHRIFLAYLLFPFFLNRDRYLARCL
jgi:hypothetical protein